MSQPVVMDARMSDGTPSGGRCGEAARLFRRSNDVQLIHESGTAGTPYSGSASELNGAEVLQRASDSGSEADSLRLGKDPCLARRAQDPFRNPTTAAKWFGPSMLKTRGTTAIVKWRCSRGTAVRPVHGGCNA